MERFNLVLNYFAAIIIASIILGSLFLTYKFLNIEEKPIQVVKIEYHGVKTDSINELNKIEIKKIDSILTKIESISKDIQLKQNQEINESKKESIYNKLYTAIIAIILAIAGFFGFKSVSDIKQQAIKDAKRQAKETAEIEFKSIFTEQFRAKIQKESEEGFMTYNKEKIEGFESRISKLETEEKIADNSTETNNNLDKQENLFDDE